MEPDAPHRTYRTGGKRLETRWSETPQKDGRLRLIATISDPGRGAARGASGPGSRVSDDPAVPA